MNIWAVCLWHVCACVYACACLYTRTSERKSERVSLYSLREYTYNWIRRIESTTCKWQLEPTMHTVDEQIQFGLMRKVLKYNMYSLAWPHISEVNETFEFLINFWIQLDVIQSSLHIWDHLFPERIDHTVIFHSKYSNFCLWDGHGNGRNSQKFRIFKSKMNFSRNTRLETGKFMARLIIHH